MDLNTWVSLAALAVFAIGLLGYLDKKFDKVDARFDRVNEKFDSIDTRFDRVNERLDKVDSKFDRVDEKLDRVNERFDRVNDRFDEIGTKIDGVDAKVGTTRDDLRSELKTDIGNLTTIVLRLDERLYDLATGSRSRPLIVPPH